MTALAVARLDATRAWLAALPRGGRTAAECGIAILVLVSFFYQTPRDVALLQLRSGDIHYPDAVVVAREFHAISPQDPPIACRATGYAGESLFFQLDTNAVDGNWPRDLPPAILSEVQHAPAVISVRSYVPRPCSKRHC